MTKKIIILAVAALLLIASLTPAMAAVNTPDRHEEMQKIAGKVLNLSAAEVGNYEKEGVGLGQLITASALDKKTNLTLKQVLDLHQKGKTFQQIAQEQKLSSQDFRQEVVKIRKALTEGKIKAGLISKEQGERQLSRMGKVGGGKMGGQGWSKGNCSGNCPNCN